MIYVLGLAGLGLAWLLPGHYFPWTSFQQEAFVAAGMGIVGLAVLASTGTRRIHWPWPARAAALLALVPLLQWRAGMFPFLADAVLPALYLLGFALAVTAGAALYEDKGSRFIGAVFGCFVAGAIASTGIALLQWLRLGDFYLVEAIDDRIYANLTQPNHFASLLGLGIAGVLWLYETRRIHGAVTSLALAFLGMGLVMAESRTGWLVAVAAALWVIGMRRRLDLRSTRRAALAALALFATAMLLWQPLNDLLLLSPPLTLARRMHDGIRPIMWATLLDAVGRAPWFGYGWSQVSIAQQTAALDFPPAHGGWTNYSHNLLLDLMVWNGVPLTLLLVAAGIWWGVNRVRACHDKDGWAALVVMTGLLIHSMVEFPFAYLYFLLPFAFMVGVLDARREPQPTGAPATLRLHLPRAAFAACLLVLAGMVTWVCTDYLEVEESARRVRLKEAGYIADGQVPTVPDVVLLDSQREFIRLWLTEAKPGMSTAELDWMRTVSRRFAPPAAMLRYALATGLNHREAEAQRTLQLICKIWWPRNCRQGRDAWAAAQEKFEALRSIPYPESDGSLARSPTATASR